MLGFSGRVIVSFMLGKSQRLVGRLPIRESFSEGVCFDDRVCLWANARSWNRSSDERTVLGDVGIFLVENSMLVKGAGSEVAVDF
jgi:hypothetical protein